MTTPASTSSCPASTFVAEWSATSQPWSSGRTRSGEATVASQTTGARVSRCSLEVRHRQDRVRRRLDQDEVGLARRRPGLVELDEADAPGLEQAHELRVAVVRGLGDRDRLPGAEQREEHGRDRAHPGREEQRPAAFECADRLLARHPGGVVVARVREQAWLAVHVRPRRRAVEPRVHAAMLSRRLVTPEAGSTEPRQGRALAQPCGTVSLGMSPSAAQRRGAAEMQT